MHKKICYPAHDMSLDNFVLLLQRKMFINFCAMQWFVEATICFTLAVTLYKQQQQQQKNAQRY